MTPLVITASELRAGDRIVGMQRHGADDKISTRHDVVAVGAGEHPVIGGECIRLQPRGLLPPGHERNFWNGANYVAETLFHVARA